MIKANTLLKTASAVFIILILLFILLFYFSIMDFKTFFSILAGALIVSINFVIGFSLIRFSINKTNEIFLLSVFGGMIFRLLLMLGIVLICLKFLEINTNSFIFSILFFYVYFLTVEILYLNLRKK